MFEIEGGIFWSILPIASSGRGYERINKIGKLVARAGSRTHTKLFRSHLDRVIDDLFENKFPMYFVDQQNKSWTANKVHPSTPDPSEHSVSPL